MYIFKKNIIENFNINRVKIKYKLPSKSILIKHLTKPLNLIIISFRYWDYRYKLLYNE